MCSGGNQSGINAARRVSRAYLCRALRYQPFPFPPRKTTDSTSPPPTDLDSMTAALTWAYHISHAGHDEGRGESAVALLQTPEDALDLRPENKLALHNAKMSPGHRDLLSECERHPQPELQRPRDKS